MQKMIFHHPLPLNPSATSASGIRPLKMIKAFQKLGYEVAILDGYGEERTLKIKLLKNRISSGEKFEFVYSESSTQPTLLTEKNHFPKYPFLDFNFFNFCRKNNIKIGLFYRDIYWLFPEYGKGLSIFKKNIAKLFYWYDILKYKTLLDIVYLPSMNMSKYIPLIEQSKFKALPPAHDRYSKITKSETLQEEINLLYIGGLGSHYQMHVLFDVLSKMPMFKFTLCTREEEWKNIKDEYKLSSNIVIVHKSGEELEKLYSKADMAMLFVKPQEYREFAAPVKLFEYIGYEKPIIASNGTLAGQFVKNEDIGWSCNYDEKSLIKLFEEIYRDKSIIFRKKEGIQQMKDAHTWEARAKEVEKDLS